jgi:hypothetical protein
MPTSVQTAISRSTASGVVEGVEVAAPVAREIVKEETETLLHSKAARRTGFITGGLLIALAYGLMAGAGDWLGSRRHSARWPTRSRTTMLNGVAQRRRSSTRCPRRRAHAGDKHHAAIRPLEPLSCQPRA